MTDVVGWWLVIIGWAAIMTAVFFRPQRRPAGRAAAIPPSDAPDSPPSVEPASGAEIDPVGSYWNPRILDRLRGWLW